MLRAFWSKAAGRGVHPADKPMISSENRLLWSLKEASLHENAFASEKHLHKKIHTKLFPQPFIGDLGSSYVYILYGNPGFAPSDYKDEFRNRRHAEACLSNLRHGRPGFFPLLPPSYGTGIANYWMPRLSNLIGDLANRLNVSTDGATEIVRQRISLIETSAYQSKSSPGSWVDSLPSSRIARQYVQEELLLKAKRREILLFVWRRANFWGLPARGVGVLLRPPPNAQGSYISREERQSIVKFLAKRVAAVEKGA